ncbi:MAG: hypothetical protein ACN2B6_02175 [Rickettsiales bacterium]
MLDALSDFWKPMKKNQAGENLKPEQLQIGTTIGFGFVPQPSLNGRRLSISSINTYQFAQESLTSFVLTHDKDSSVSMIVAESEGEQYLAISRRISIADRMKMFDSQDLENIMNKAEITTLSCKEMIQDFKGWLVSSYKREIQGMSGRIFKGDFRKHPLPPQNQAQEFGYTLLVSESNEHAIEIEKYNDGRIEVYATIYRRMTDIGEITNPPRAELNRPDLKLASDEVSKKKEALEKEKSNPSPAVEKLEKTEAVQVSPLKPEETKTEPMKLPEFEKTPLPKAESLPEVKPEPKEEKKPEPVKAEEPVKPSVEEKKPMANLESAKNGADKNSSLKPTFSSVAAESIIKQEIKTVSKDTDGAESASIECDLRIANKIIDEAIRSEMRLSDVVRRIVELPVAHQEAVQIPVNLSEEDYSLLAIRYGISSSDKEAIKRRILEDITDFSGEDKKAA